jgi:hypothetical protein
MPAHEAKALDCPAQLMRRNAGVALGRVEVLVAQELLDLAQVGAGAQKLRGEDVAQGVGGDSLSLADPCGPHVAQKVWVRMVAESRLPWTPTKSGPCAALPRTAR